MVSNSRNNNKKNSSGDLQGHELAYAKDLDEDDIFIKNKIHLCLEGDEQLDSLTACRKAGQMFTN